YALESTHPAIDREPATQKRAIWTGRVLSALPVLFLIADGAMKVLDLQVVREASAQLGLAPGSLPTIGAVLLACTALYLVPRLAPLGAVLLTGYLGGAIAINVRAETPVFNLVFPLIVAALLWGGLFLRDGRVRELARSLVSGRASGR